MTFTCSRQVESQEYRPQHYEAAEADSGEEDGDLAEVDLAEDALEHDLVDGGARRRRRPQDHPRQGSGLRYPIHVGQERDARVAQDHSYDL